MDEAGLEFHFVIPAEYDGQRADKVVSALGSDLSRGRVQSLIARGEVILDGRVLKQASLKVKEGQEITVRVPEPEPAEPEAEAIALDILYEDEDVIVINKPAGLVVHPGAGNWSGTLVNALLYHCGESLSGIGGVARPGIVHRLDKDTSGVMIVAKNDVAHQHLSAQLADRRLGRVYHALLLGVPMPVKGVIDLPIGRHRQNRLRMAIKGSGAREARTHYRVLHSFGEACSLVECTLESGRTHQIRVHMEAAGYPILGDPLYGAQLTKVRSVLKKNNYSPDIIDKIGALERQMLHAKKIRFIHPKSGVEMFFETDLLDDFSKVLKLLYK